ncbi:unnamed protein product, partial [Rotaria sp. Silwood2]
IDFDNVRCHYIFSITCAKRITRSEAIISVLTDDEFLLAVLVLGFSLNKHHAVIDRDMILFISQGTIYSTRHLAMLKAVGWKLVYVKPRRFPGTVKPRLVDGLIKLYAWNLTQYKMIATFDADAVVIGSIEEPFKYLRTNPNIQMLAVDNPSISLAY